MLRDAAAVFGARLRFDELVSAVRANPGDDRAAAELHHWLADVRPRLAAALRRLPAGPVAPVLRLAPGPERAEVDP